MAFRVDQCSQQDQVRRRNFFNQCFTLQGLSGGSSAFCRRVKARR
jgi:hypothetical protein